MCGCIYIYIYVETRPCPLPTEPYAFTFLRLVLLGLWPLVPVAKVYGSEGGSLVTFRGRKVQAQAGVHKSTGTPRVRKSTGKSWPKASTNF